jgi:hypothetical protein
MHMSSAFIQLQDVSIENEELPTTIYCPISHKDEMNKPAYNRLDDMTNTEIFLSDKNMNYISYAMISLNNVNNTNIDTNILQSKIPNLMKVWAVKNAINSSTSATGNIIHTLEFLNKKFLTNHGSMYGLGGHDSLNVFRTKTSVSDRCGRTDKKKHNELLASDYHTLDLWNDTSNEVFAYNRAYRYCNKIPMWQRSMNRRHYDVSNDGLRAATSDRASLENQTHGYDMSNIVKGSTNYENYYYENL